MQKLTQVPPPDLAPKALVPEHNLMLPDVAPSALPVGSDAELKAGLAKFVDSMHQKAASLTSWISSLEPPLNEHPSQRAIRLLTFFLCIMHARYRHLCKLKRHDKSRFVGECKTLLDQLEQHFLAVAECQHTLEYNGRDDAQLGTQITHV